MLMGHMMVPPEAECMAERSRRPDSAFNTMKVDATDSHILLLRDSGGNSSYSGEFVTREQYRWACRELPDPL